jgi:hypothetical protein
MTQFQIVCTRHPNLAIQAGAGVGQGLTLSQGWLVWTGLC